MLLSEVWGGGNEEIKINYRGFRCNEMGILVELALSDSMWQRTRDLRMFSMTCIGLETALEPASGPTGIKFAHNGRRTFKTI